MNVKNKAWQAQKSFKFNVKSIDDNGTFEGYASVYGNVDLANEVVEPGAFKRTLDHNKSMITLLWQHDVKQPIGVGYLEDSECGLKIKGELNLDVEKGREAFSLLKQKAIKGLSIGYDVVKDLWEKGVRRLKELKLWEVSVVTFPCNTLANVTDVKNYNNYTAIKDFNSELAQEVNRDNMYKINWAFESAIRKTIEDADINLADKINMANIIFEQYKTAFINWLSNVIQTEDSLKSVDGNLFSESKVGKPISSARLNKLKDALSTLNALLNEFEPESDSDKSVDSDDGVNSKELCIDEIIKQMQTYTTSKMQDEKHEINIFEGIK